MAHKIGYVDDSNGQFAHYNFFTVLREFALGYGTVSNQAYTGTGNGTLENVKALPNAVTETWTLTCTAASVDGGTFSVTGSVSGAQADATVGTTYNNGFVSFLISDGTIDFIVGDKFTFNTTQSNVSANGENWEELMYDDSGTNWHTMLRGNGLTGNENIYIGFHTYHSVANDYYNMAVCAMTGHFPSSSFYSQPGFVRSGIPLYKDRIDYWITLNAQRITFVCKVAGYIYHTGYVGKFFPYASPMQYPYPMLCAGMFGYGDESVTAALGYSGGRLPYYGNGQMSLSSSTYAANNFRVYSSFVGRWFPFGCYPGRNNQGVIRGDLIDLDGLYPVMPYELFNAGGSYLLNETPRGIYGKLDGVYWVSGWNNYPEYTMTIDGKTFIIFREKNSTSTAAYFAISLDA